MADITVVMGSASDAKTVKLCLDVLEKLKIDYTCAIASAHRTPDRLEKLIAEADRAGTKVFICAAGMAAHLAGAVAARTIKPVIGIPLSSGALAGMDALFSTAQMPGGFPVATVALDKAGATNAGWLGAQILALGDAALSGRIEACRAEMRAKVDAANRELAEGNLLA